MKKFLLVPIMGLLLSGSISAGGDWPLNWQEDEESIASDAESNTSDTEGADSAVARQEAVLRQRAVARLKLIQEYIGKTQTIINEENQARPAYPCALEIKFCDYDYPSQGNASSSPLSRALLLADLKRTFPQDTKF